MIFKCIKLSDFLNYNQYTEIKNCDYNRFLMSYDLYEDDNRLCY